MRHKNKNGQNTLEMCLVIVCSAAAVIVMSNYVVRAMQGALKEQADDLGMQYAPGNTTGITVENATRQAINTYIMLNSTELSARTGINPTFLDENRYYFLSEEIITEDINKKNIDEEYEGFE